MTARVAGCVLVCAGLLACADEPTRQPLVSGDAARGRAALVDLDCGVCHVIPGIRTARGNVGPPLGDYRERAYVAGKWPNEPANLIRFIRDPPAMAPRTAMPAVGVADAQARDIAAYLYE